jgi:hypothetical protein
MRKRLGKLLQTHKVKVAVGGLLAVLGGWLAGSMGGQDALIAAIGVIASALALAVPTSGDSKP